MIVTTIREFCSPTTSEHKQQIRNNSELSNIQHCFIILFVLCKNVVTELFRTECRCVWSSWGTVTRRGLRIQLNENVGTTILGMSDVDSGKLLTEENSLSLNNKLLRVRESGEASHKMGNQRKRTSASGRRRWRKNFAHLTYPRGLLSVHGSMAQ